MPGFRPRRARLPLPPSLPLLPQTLTPETLHPWNPSARERGEGERDGDGDGGDDADGGRWLC